MRHCKISKQYGSFLIKHKKEQQQQGTRTELRSKPQNCLALQTCTGMLLKEKEILRLDNIKHKQYLGFYRGNGFSQNCIYSRSVFSLSMI